MLAPAEAPDLPALVVLEATGRRVTVETIEGALFTGTLAAFDATVGNVELIDVRCQAKDSSLSISERMLVKADQVRMIRLPVEVQKAPVLDWRSDNVQQALVKALKPKKRSVKKVTKRESQTEKRKHEKKLKKLR